MEERERECVRCRELWPDDREFFKGQKHIFCIACEKEIDVLSPSGSIFTMPPELLEKQINSCRAARIAAMSAN